MCSIQSMLGEFSRDSLEKRAKSLPPRARARSNRDALKKPCVVARSCPLVQCPSMALGPGPGLHGPLVGRGVELASLLAALDEAAGGHTQLALLSGEPGIGKTRLARTLGDLARERGVSSAWGRAW